jgi:hypothetical protein
VSLRPFAACLALLCLAACGNADRARLDRGMAFAHARFAEVATNPLAAVAFGSAGETGGSLSGYLAASMPPNADLPRFRDGAPEGPWGIALRALGDGRVVIEGYGASLDRPIRADTVAVR